MDEKRRAFSQKSGRRRSCGLTLGAAGTAEANYQTENLPGYPDQFGVLVDTTVCIGCRRCEWACKDWNKLPNQKSLKETENDKSVFDKRRTDYTPTPYTVVNPLPKS